MLKFLPIRADLFIHPHFFHSPASIEGCVRIQELLPLPCKHCGHPEYKLPLTCPHSVQTLTKSVFIPALLLISKTHTHTIVMRNTFPSLLSKPCQGYWVNRKHGPLPYCSGWKERHPHFNREPACSERDCLLNYESIWGSKSVVALWV